MIDEKKLLEKLEELKFANEEKGYDTAKDVVQEIINLVKEQPNADWIPCEVEMPKERDSIFAKAKGTDKWNDAMFEKISSDVNVTVELEDGSRITKTSHTIDGKWKEEREITLVKQKVIAWQSLPQPYKEEGENGE